MSQSNPPKTVKTYPGNGISVQFDAARCIHAAECVRGLPAVFDPQAKPWIQPGKALADEVAAVVSRCPTGALTIRNANGGAVEIPASKNTATLVANGPIYLRGQIEHAVVNDAAPAEFLGVALCRCGASTNSKWQLEISIVKRTRLTRRACSDPTRPSATTKL